MTLITMDGWPVNSQLQWVTIQNKGAHFAYTDKAYISRLEKTNRAKTSAPIFVGMVFTMHLYDALNINKIKCTNNLKITSNHYQ